MKYSPYSFNPLGVLYAPLSLAIIRMIPVALPVVGTRLRPDTTFVMAWFGPRGLASIVLVVFMGLGLHNTATFPLVERKGEVDSMASRFAV
jgi:NhaP-type Na+/H+ or K+/H+ antiporter